jgi:hypothetical protein
MRFHGKEGWKQTKTRGESPSAQGWQSANQASQTVEQRFRMMIKKTGKHKVLPLTAWEMRRRVRLKKKPPPA